MRTNKIKRMLKSGDMLAVPEINRVFSPKIVDVLGFLGYECVWIDMEHSDLNYDQIYHLAGCARAAGMDVIVRIPRGEYSTVIKPLEAGANGLVLPHCMSAQDAREFVRKAKFAPLGLRGMGGGIDSHFGTMPAGEYTKLANEETLLAVMIEDKEAVDAADDIAAVDGIDLLFIGPGDLSQSYGITGQVDHPLMLQAMENVSNACRKHGKAWGSVGGAEEYLDKLLERGAQFINIASEITTLANGFRAAREYALRKFGKGE